MKFNRIGSTGTSAGTPLFFSGIRRKQWKSRSEPRFAQGLLTDSSTVTALEDELCDVISKAQRGLGMATSALAQQAGLPLPIARALRSGTWTGADLAAAAPALRLRLEGLVRLAENRYAPSVDPMSGLHVLDMPAPMSGYETMRVNAFLVLPENSPDAFLFDTGTDAGAIALELEKRGRTLRAIFITHAHWDHCDCLPGLRKRFPEAVVFGPDESELDPIEVLRGGDLKEWSALSVEARETAGHAPQSLSFVVRGLPRPLALVGDAIFAGSVGGMPELAYTSGLQAIRDQLLSLPEDTVIGPGHGRLTTVGYERAHNPFFPGMEKISE